MSGSPDTLALATQLEKLGISLSKPISSSTVDGKTQHQMTFTSRVVRMISPTQLETCSDGKRQGRPLPFPMAKLMYEVCSHHRSTLSTDASTEPYFVLNEAASTITLDEAALNSVKCALDFYGNLIEATISVFSQWVDSDKLDNLTLIDFFGLVWQRISPASKEPKACYESITEDVLPHFSRHAHTIKETLVRPVLKPYELILGEMAITTLKPAATLLEEVYKEHTDRPDFLSKDRAMALLSQTKIVLKADPSMNTLGFASRNRQYIEFSLSELYLLANRILVDNCGTPQEQSFWFMPARYQTLMASLKLMIQRKVSPFVEITLNTHITSDLFSHYILTQLLPKPPILLPSSSFSDESSRILKTALTTRIQTHPHLHVPAILMATQQSEDVKPCTTFHELLGRIPGTAYQKDYQLPLPEQRRDILCPYSFIPHRSYHDKHYYQVHLLNALLNGLILLQTLRSLAPADHLASIQRPPTKNTSFVIQSDGKERYFSFALSSLLKPFVAFTVVPDTAPLEAFLVACIKLARQTTINSDQVLTLFEEETYTEFSSLFMSERYYTDFDIGLITAAPIPVTGLAEAIETHQLLAAFTTTHLGYKPVQKSPTIVDLTNLYPEPTAGAPAAPSSAADSDADESHRVTKRVRVTAPTGDDIKLPYPPSSRPLTVGLKLRTTDGPFVFLGLPTPLAAPPTYGDDTPSG